MGILEALADQAFCRVADARHSTGNTVRLLRDGAETYPASLDAIGHAARTIDLENYIIQDDAVGRQFADALIAAAGRGVTCRVLYDWLGCLTRTKKPFWDRLRDAGIEVRAYNKAHIGNPLGWISRDHRKVLCVDGAVGITGGLCIGHDWVGDKAKNIPPWRDTAIRIEGPAAGHLAAAFADSWDAAGGETQNAVEPGPGIGDVSISVIAGRPGGMSLYRVEQLVAEVVEKSLWLSDGYFVATTFYVRALAAAARAGVDVRLLVPGSSNWPVVGALSQSAYRPLLQAGVRVFEWNGPMLHAKTAVADGTWTRIGSSNSNLASWVSNRELDVTIKDATLAAEMEAMFEADMQNSTEVVLVRGRSGVMRPDTLNVPRIRRRPRVSASRFVSGAIGFGNTLGASFAQRRTLGAAESLVLFGGGLLVLLGALIALLLPRFIAYPIAIAAFWFAATLLIHAWHLWRSGNPKP